MKRLRWLINLCLSFLILGCATGGTYSIPLLNRILTDVFNSFLSNLYET